MGRAPAEWAQELCAPEPLHPCPAGVLQGGWPLAFLIDRPGVSVMGQLAPVEDAFRPLAYALDVLAIWLVLLVVRAVGGGVRRLRRPRSAAS